MVTAHPRCAMMVSVLAAGTAHAQALPEAYTLVELQPLGGGTEAFVAAINDRGEIVGRTESGAGPIATRWDIAGAAAVITVAGGAATDAFSINDEGLMVVHCDGCGPGGGGLAGVRLVDGTVLELPAPAEPGEASVVPRVSSLGSVGGRLVFEDPPASGEGEIFAVLWELSPGPAMVPRVVGSLGQADGLTTFLNTFEGGVVSDGGLLGFASLSAVGSGSFIAVDHRTGASRSSFSIGGLADTVDVNASGAVLGVSMEVGGRITSVLEPDGSDGLSIEAINCEPGFACGVFARVNGTAISDTGLVVGSADIFADPSDFDPVDNAGFIWSPPSGTVDLASLINDGSADGWDLLQFDGMTGELGGPADINNAGVIVGNGINPLGEPAAYVLIPRSPCAADTNRDGMVSPADYNAWILSFNNGCD